MAWRSDWKQPGWGRQGKTGAEAGGFLSHIDTWPCIHPIQEIYEQALEDSVGINSQSVPSNSKLTWHA